MISRIFHWLMLATLTLIFASCGVTPAKQAPGELGRQFTATVPGAWSGRVTSGGLDCQMYKQFARDGSAQGVLLVKKREGGVSLVLPEIPFSSRWRVKGDVVETYEIKAGVPGLFKKGEVIRDTILSVSPNRIVCRSNENGRLEIIERVVSSR